MLCSRGLLEVVRLPRIVSTAPGKLVLTGDYVVLLGAPALVLAVDRRASATYSSHTEASWEVRSNTAPTQRFESLREAANRGEMAVLHHVYNELDDRSALPSHGVLNLDSSPMYLDKEKLGIGSSAAILVALEGLFAHITHQSQPMDVLFRIHRTLQDGEGSGLDVAAARHGGLIRFQNGKTTQLDRPLDLGFKFLFTGRSSRTSTMLARFRRQLEKFDPAALDTWKDLAERTAHSVMDAPAFLTNLFELNQFLFDFDQMTQLGIYSDPHHLAVKVAGQAGVLYKPSGAGGGDMGIAVSDDPDALTRFEQQTSDYGLLSIDLNITSRGQSIEL